MWRAQPPTQRGHFLLSQPSVCDGLGLPTCQDSCFRGERHGEFPDDIRRAVVHEEAKVADGRVENQRDRRGEGAQHLVASSLQSLVQTLHLLVFTLGEETAVCSPRSCCQDRGLSKREATAWTCDPRKEQLCGKRGFRQKTKTRGVLMGKGRGAITSIEGRHCCGCG